MLREIYGIVLLVIFALSTTSSKIINESSIETRAPVVSNSESEVSPIARTQGRQGIEELKGIDIEGILGKKSPPKGQYSGVPLELEEFLKQKRGHIETVYQPYWNKGHLVFNRTKDIAKIPKHYPTHNNTKKAYLLQCLDSICPKIFKNYGKVCAEYLNTYHWDYHRREFDNLCHLQYENCRVKHDRRQRGHDWFPIHRGPCDNYWKPQDAEYDDKTLLKRVDTYLAPFLRRINT